MAAQQRKRAGHTRARPADRARAREGRNIMRAGASQVEAPPRESARTVWPWMRDVLPERESWSALSLPMGKPESRRGSVWVFRRTEYGPPSLRLLADPK